MSLKDKIIDASDELKKYPEWLSKKYLQKVRHKAIDKVKKELSLRQKNIEDFSDDELEALIADEEKEVMKSHKMGSMQALLILLGIYTI
mgnify:FL=1|jgi:ribosomal protein L14E/L6E/L27E|tara:strand:+ start:189 stop:455 length:267 start_codon:yes stop_codon:yes gene_type:complete